MSPFTDYLVNTGRLSEEQLLRACVEQLEATPPLAAVVMHQGLLKPEQQLLVLRKQAASDGLSYQQACAALGLWTSELSAAVDAAIVAARPSLAQILVDKELIQAPLVTLLRSSAAVRHQVINTSLEAVRIEFDQLNQVLVDEYSLLFREGDYLKILAVSAALPTLPPAERRPALDTILEQIQSAHRGLNFLGFKSVDGLLTATLQLLEALIAIAPDFDSGTTAVLHAGLELFWQLSPSNLSTSKISLQRAS